MGNFFSAHGVLVLDFDFALYPARWRKDDCVDRYFANNLHDCCLGNQFLLGGKTNGPFGNGNVQSGCEKRLLHFHKHRLFESVVLVETDFGRYVHHYCNDRSRPRDDAEKSKLQGFEIGTEEYA